MNNNSPFFNNPGTSGGNIPPGTFTEGSVIFAAADGTLTQDNANFFYSQADVQLGIGLNTGLEATLHIKGDSPTLGSAFYVQNSTTEAFRIYNNRKIVAGGGSAVASTDFTFNAFGGATGSDYSFQVVGAGSDNIFRIKNSTSLTDGGVHIVRDANNNRAALTFYGIGTAYMQFSSNGSMHYQAGSSIANIVQLGGFSSTGFSTDATYPGLYQTLTTNATYGFHFTKQQSSGLSNQNTGFPFFNIFGSWGELNNNVGSDTTTMFKMQPVYNYTGTHARDVIGFDYSPTVTSLSNGKHYGFLVRTPSSLNGFGLASSLPTALLHLAGSTTVRASFRIESGTLPTGSDHKDGDFTYDGTDINFRQGSTTKLLEFQPRNQTVNATTATTTIDFVNGNVVILNLQTATTALTLSNLRPGTYIIIVKQDATGGRLLTYTTTINWPAATAPTLTVTANESDVITLVYDGTNIRGAYTQDFAV